MHPYIAEQAFLIWPKDTSHEIYQYLGYGYRDELGGNNPLTVPIACGNATVGNIITEGAKEEDDYDPVGGEVCTIEPDPFTVGFDLTYGYNHHFYDPDINSSNNGLNDDLGALAYSKIYFDRAKSAYQNNDKGTAYWYLGRIAHLLSDVSVPAHVLRDRHFPYTFLPSYDLQPDSYEKYTASNYTLWNFRSANELLASHPLPSSWTLDELFYCLAQQAQFFPSDNMDGNKTISNPDCDGVLQFPLPDTTGMIRNADGADVYFLDTELRTIGDYMMPRSFQYVAQLYKYFWHEFHIDIVDPAEIKVLNPAIFRAVGKLNGDAVSLWEWDFSYDGVNFDADDSGQSVSHVFKNWGNITIALRVNGQEIITKNIYVSPPPIDVSYPHGFEDLYRHFETPYNSIIQSYVWDFGDGVVRTDDDNTTSHPYATSGYYTVTLTLTLDDNSTIQSTAGIFVGPGTRYIQGHTIYDEEKWYAGGTYVIQGSITVAQGAKLTIEPGTRVELNGEVGIYVNGTLKANGTSSNKITFTWATEDQQWAGIHFIGAASSGSRLEGCEITHASGITFCCYGCWPIWAISIQHASPTITGCTIDESTAPYGIWMKDASPVISGNTISGFASAGIGLDDSSCYSSSSSPTVTDNQINNNGTGIAIGNQDGGTYQGDTISGNTSYGLYYSGINTIDATNCNWGDPSGPLDESDDRSTGGLYNPNGLGNRVSDHVNYYPWIGSTAPAVPTGLSGNPGNQEINLTWNAVSDPSLDGYKIYYGTSSGNYGAPVKIGSVTAHQLTQLTNGIPYYIAISSVNFFGAESAKCTEIMVTPNADIDKPTSMITQPLSGSNIYTNKFIIKGSANDGEGNGVQKVEVSTDGGATWNLVTGTTSWSYAWMIPGTGDIYHQVPCNG